MRYYVVMKVGDEYAKVPVEIRRSKGSCSHPPVDPAPMDNYVTYNVYNPAVQHIHNAITRLLSKQDMTDVTLNQHNFRLEALESLYRDGEIDLGDYLQLKEHLDSLDLTPGGLHLVNDEENEDEYKIVFFAEDDSRIKHFILEKYDEETNKWLPYDSEQGVVY